MEDRDIKKIVKNRYGKIAQKNSSCCGQSCLCGQLQNPADSISQFIGYSKEELTTVPEGADLGLGCGNPVALASLREGETVLDLGSGAGFDCFLSANRVGKKGKVIGIDMTPEMIERSRENAEKGGYENVEFRLGDIENLPIKAESVDVVISNCVINLSQEKDKVFKEAFRVLKPGGRLMISDIVLLRELPQSIRNSVQAHTGCVAGAMKRDDYIQNIKAAGFQSVEILGEAPFSLGLDPKDPAVRAILEESGMQPDRLSELAQAIRSIKICGYKRRGGG
jgi:arsenite methyltransferase